MTSAQEQPPLWIPGVDVYASTGRDIEIAPQLLDGISPDALEVRASRLHRAIIGLGGLNSLAISAEEAFPNQGQDEIREVGAETWMVHTSPDGIWKTSRSMRANQHNQRNGGLTIAGGAFVDTENSDPTQRAQEMGQAIAVARRAVRYHNIRATYSDKSGILKAMAAMHDISVTVTATSIAAHGIKEQNLAVLLTSPLYLATHAGWRLTSNRSDRNFLQDVPMSARPFRAAAANALLRTTLVRTNQSQQ